jgi:predicted phage baseplate assembly protein
MPLDSYLPAIDDRRYSDIVAEIRTRIARYAPEWRPGDSAWTDVNDSDPGITIAQVFAWQAEMLLYRLNKVPALNYIKFLELIGIELQAAAPAQAEITFPLKPQPATPTVVIVPSRTQLSADPGDGQPPLIFETIRALTAIRALLDAVLVKEFIDYNDVSDANADGTHGFSPFGNTAPDSAEFALGFNDPDPFPETELDLAVIVQDTATAGGYVQCTGVPVTPRFAPAQLHWDYWNGTRWIAMKLLKDGSLAFTRSGHIRLRLPAAGSLQKVKLVPTQAVARYWIRAVLDKGQYENPPLILAIRTNTVAAEQAETMHDEVVGGSDGSRNQKFQLSNTPVLAGTLRLEIQQSDVGFEPWVEVEDFFGAGPTDEVYVLDRTTGEILFGDGVNGAIPVAYVNNPGANVVAREYRVGGGSRGNVAAGVIKTLVTSITGVDEGAVGNLQDAFGGREEETLDDAKKRAPRSLKSRCRAVTVDDFELLAMEAGNVRRAKALPLYDPRFPGTPVPGVVSVIVVPDSKTPNPMPSDGTLRTVCAYLDARRLLTTELYVLRPSYQLIEIKGQVVAADSADLAEVSQAIDAALVRYFHPLNGGENGSGWPFGGTIYYSRVYQQVFAVDGVASISTLTIVLDGIEQPPCTDVPIVANGLLYSTSHSVDVAYAADGGEQ